MLIGASLGGIQLFLIACLVVSIFTRKASSALYVLILFWILSAITMIMAVTAWGILTAGVGLLVTIISLVRAYIRIFGHANVKTCTGRE